MVVTPGVASARSIPFSFTTMPMISGGSVPVGREALSSFITSSLSAICFTCFGETKLTASMCRKPASTSSFKYSALYSVGICSGNPCHASLGHSISFTCSAMKSYFECDCPERARRRKVGTRKSQQRRELPKHSDTEHEREQISYPLSKL